MIKLTLPAGDAQTADTLGEVLAELEPPPLAITQFRAAGRDHWRVEAYCADEADKEQLASACRARIPGWAGTIGIEAVPDANWVAISQAALPPVAVGPFLVHGSHDRQAVSRRQWAIEIDANEAFGTAHHASTRGCLVALARLARRNRFIRVLDLGCGSGVLALAAARVLPTASIVACDIDARAIEVARTNARINRLCGRITFAVADGLSHPRLRQGGFDLVLANITAEPLMGLATRMARIVRARGYVVLAGLLNEEADKVTAAYRAAGFVRTSAVAQEDWTTLLLQRRHPLRLGVTASSCSPRRRARAPP